MFVKKAGVLLLLLSLFMAGCSAQENNVSAVEDPNIELIKKYLEIEYNGPDEEAIRVLEEMFNAETESGKSGVEQYTDYINETFSPYLEDAAIQEFILTNLVFAFHQDAHNNGFTFKTDHIDLKQQEGFEQNYDYQIGLTYEKDGQKHSTTLTGFVTISADGKISGIRPLNSGGLYTAMLEHSQKNQDNGFLAWGILQEQFGRTDHKLNKLLAGAEEPLENQPLLDYLDRKYGSYFSKGGFEDFIASRSFIYPAIAAEKGYDLSVGNIEVLQNKDEPTIYNISVTVHYGKEGSEKNTTIVTGTSIIKDGPVEKLEILDDGGLAESLRK